MGNWFGFITDILYLASGGSLLLHSIQTLLKRSFQLMPTYMIFVLVKEDYIFFYGLKGASLPHDIQVKILFNKDKATKTIVSCNYTLHVLFTTKKYQHSHIPLA